jgi:hypothetical protein
MVIVISWIDEDVLFLCVSYVCCLLLLPVCTKCGYERILIALVEYAIHCFVIMFPLYCGEGQLQSRQQSVRL